MEFREQLPSSFRHRFDSLSGYVNAIIEQKRAGSQSLSKDERGFIQIVIFITALKRFLRDGADAAQMTLEALKDQGITSFSIGSSKFEEGSEDLKRGYILANELEDVVSDPKIKEWIRSDKQLYQLVDDLYRHVLTP